MVNTHQKRLKLPHLILIAGSGRNVGKTGLCCRIIAALAKTNSVAALKISNGLFAENSFHGHHTHTTPIFKETDTKGNKDSMRFLQAGAADSWFLQTSDESLFLTFQQVLSEIGKDQLLVCESNALIRWVQPGLFIGIAGKNSTKGFYEEPDVVFKALDFNSFDAFVQRLAWNKGRFVYLKIKRM